MKNWYHKLHSDEINKSSHQKSPKIAKIATWRNFEKVDFGKNGAKSSLMMFHTTFVRKKSEMFMQMSISMSTPFLPHCAVVKDHVKQKRDAHLVRKWKVGGSLAPILQEKTSLRNVISFWGYSFITCVMRRKNPTSLG